MMALRFCLAVLSALAFGMGQPAQAQDWQLVDADTLSQENFLILTVPLESPETLAVLADEIADRYGLPLSAEWPLRAIAVHCFIFDASDKEDVDAIIEAMQADETIRTVQRMQSFELSENGYSDPLYPLQRSLEMMNAAAAHQTAQGSGVTVGVVDTGIDSAHPDLANRVQDLRDFVAAAPGQPSEAHGTAIAGIIAAEAFDAVGMVGIAPQADLIGLRACWQVGTQGGACNSFSLARALNFALLNEVDVLNLSIGGRSDPLLEELINTAMAQGMIIVAASGEDDAIVFPASVEGVIAAGQAMTGRIPAPMVDVLTTAPGNKHRYVSGSSVATAHVSGVVALMLSQDSTLTGAQISDALKASIETSQEVPMLDACLALYPAPQGQEMCAN